MEENVTIDIKTLRVEQRRNTFGHIARRLGADKPASRYEEGTLDLQATDNFHYKPLWGADHWVFDKRRTAIQMEDWYVLRDPRQYYYASYNIARANQYQATEHNFDFVEKRGLMTLMDQAWRETVAFYLLPLRHVEWGANMNSTDICDRGYGAAVTAPCIFSAGDHLAMAQIIGRIGLMLDRNTGSLLEQAKTDWMDAAEWQGVRRMVEDSFVIGDWFEQFIAQNLCMDGVLYPLVYSRFEAAGQSKNAAGLSMLTEFMSEWFTEHSRWADSVVKSVVAESPANKALVEGWFATWCERATAAYTPLATKVLGAEAGKAAIDQTVAELRKRAAGLGLSA
jgi:phenol hydroxylase P1 protein